MARAMVTQYGMSSDLGVQIFGQPNHEVFLGRDYGNTQDYSDETARRIDDEVARIMRQAHDTAYEILSQHKEQMDLMAKVLLERETVDGEACQALLDNRWEEYAAHEASEEGKKAREEAATTVVDVEPVEATDSKPADTAELPAASDSEEKASGASADSAAPATPTAETPDTDAPAGTDADEGKDHR